MLCEICVDNRALMINEQKLFRPDELKRHIWHGDFDDDGNVVFLHPYCEFCDKHFYDEEKFIIHLRDTHFRCDFCTEAHNWRWYNTYENLQIHFNMSHYACKEQECIQKGFVVFRTNEELNAHINKTHKKIQGEKGAKTKISLACTEFRYEGGGRLDGTGDNKILDSEGVDMSKQLLSMQKVKMKYNSKKDTYDEKFDIREFLDNNLNRANLTV